MKMSVVIIARNEAHIIGQTLQSLVGLTDDIVVVDTGSTDGTQEICNKAGTRVLEIEWSGYGPSKNKGIGLAKYDWILSLDADESIDEELKQQLSELKQEEEDKVYTLRFRNFYCNKCIRFGEWGRDKHARLFNRKRVQWNSDGVHEGLVLPAGINKITLSGYVIHHTADTPAEYRDKTTGYAKLYARKMVSLGTKTGPFKKYLSSGFSFIQNYIIRLGFLDGAAGWQIAMNSARCAYLKYAWAEYLNKQPGVTIND